MLSVPAAAGSLAARLAELLGAELPQEFVEKCERYESIATSLVENLTAKALPKLVQTLPPVVANPPTLCGQWIESLSTFHSLTASEQAARVNILRMHMEYSAAMSTVEGFSDILEAQISVVEGFPVSEIGPLISSDGNGLAWSQVRPSRERRPR